MQKFEREQTHVIDISEIEKMLNEDPSNPTIRRLMFVETRSTQKGAHIVFPCYPAYFIEPNDEEKSLVFFAIQCVGGNYQSVCIKIPISDIGVKCRFWSLPPTDELMQKMPMANAKQVQ